MSEPEVKFKPSDKNLALIILGVMGAAVGIGMWGLYLLLPILLELAQNLIIFGVEIGVLLLMVMGVVQLFLSRDAIFYKMKLFARRWRKRIAKEDPLGTIAVSKAKFEQKLEEIDEHTVSANGALTRLKDKITNRGKTGLQDVALHEDELADTAERMNRPQLEIQQHAINAQRARTAADTIKPMIEDQEWIKSQLAKARDVAANAIEDLKNKQMILTIQFDAYKESQAQARAFKKFFGSSPELEMIEFAVDEVEKQTADAQAEIDQLMSQLSPRIAAAQLQREAEAQAAMAKREESKKLASPTAPLAINPPKITEQVTIKR